MCDVCVSGLFLVAKTIKQSGQRPNFVWVDANPAQFTRDITEWYTLLQIGGAIAGPAQHEQRDINDQLEKFATLSVERHETFWIIKRS